MPKKNKKQKVLLRRREPEIVKRHRRARGKRWRRQVRGATQYLNAMHGISYVEADEPPQVIELLKANQPAEPVFHGMPRFYLSGLTDLDFAINGHCRQEARVVSRWTIRGVHTGELLGVPPTRREVTFTGVTLTALEGELIKLGDDFKTEAGAPLREQWAWWVVEEWNYWDFQRLVAQLRGQP